MSQKKAPRIGLLEALVARRVTGREVAAALDMSVGVGLKPTSTRGMRRPSAYGQRRRLGRQGRPHLCQLRP